MKKYHNYELVIYPSDKVIDQAELECQYWTSILFIHVSGNKYLPPNMPDPRGLGFLVRARVDADHAGDTVTRRSRTENTIYVSTTTVYRMP